MAGADPQVHDISDRKSALASVRTLAAAGRSAEAEELCKKLLATWPEWLVLWGVRGEIAQQAGNLSSAEQCFRAVLNLRPDNLLAQYSLGRVLALQYRYAEAERLLKQALATQPDDRNVALDLAHVLSAQWKHPESVRILSPVVEKHRDDATAWTKMGEAYLDQCTFDEAERCLRRAIALGRNQPELMIKLAAALWSQGKAKEAEETCRSALKRYPDDLSLWDHLGLIELLEEGKVASLREAGRRRSLPVKPTPLAALANPVDSRCSVSVLAPSPASDVFGAMSLRRHTLVFGLRKNGYRVPETGEKPDRPSDAQIVVGLTSFRMAKGQRTLLVISPPLYVRGFRELLQRSIWGDEPPDIAIIDHDSKSFAESLTGRPVRLLPAMYQPGMLDEERAVRPLSQRPIRILYAGSWENPEKYRSAWRTDPVLARLGDSLVESARGQFTTPLVEHARQVLSHLKLELDLSEERGCLWLDLASKYLLAEHKNRVLRTLARYPCHLILSRKQIPLDFHPQSRVFHRMPYPLYLDLMHESQAVVATLPSYMTGAISERVPGPIVRGAVLVATRNNGLIRSGLRLGREVMDYGFDESELEAHLDRVMSGDPSLQEMADAGRTAGRRLFDPVARTGELMASWEKTWTN